MIYAKLAFSYGRHNARGFVWFLPIVQIAGETRMNSGIAPPGTFAGAV